MKTPAKFLVMFLPVLLLNGCVTRALWNSTEDFNEPAPNPNLQLFFAEQKKDFLVVYDECYTRKGAIRRQAYYLFQNVEGKKHRMNFVSTNQVAGLAPVPVYAQTAVLATSSAFYVLAETNSASFQLSSSNGVIGTYQLPVYNDGKGKYARMMWTPLTVAADATIVGGVIGAYAAYCWGADGGHSIAVH